MLSVKIGSAILIYIEWLPVSVRGLVMRLAQSPTPT
jgi:hypothetical protein